MSGETAVEPGDVWPPAETFMGEALEWVEVGPENWVSKPKTATDGIRYSWWAHRSPATGHNDLGRIVYGGGHHELVSEDPLHIEPSLLCAGSVCGFHGYVRAGKWEPA